jgi:hypothetical protein
MTIFIFRLRFNYRKCLPPAGEGAEQDQPCPSVRLVQLEQVAFELQEQLESDIIYTLKTGHTSPTKISVGTVCVARWGSK